MAGINSNPMLDILKQTSISPSDTPSIKKHKKIISLIVIIFLLFFMALQLSTLGIMEDFFSNWFCPPSNHTKFFTTFLIHDQTESTIKKIHDILGCENNKIKCIKLN